MTDCHGPLSRVLWLSVPEQGELGRELAPCLSFSSLRLTGFGLIQPHQVFCLVALSTHSTEKFCATPKVTYTDPAWPGDVCGFTHVRKRALVRLTPYQKTIQPGHLVVPSL